MLIIKVKSKHLYEGKSKSQNFQLIVFFIKIYLIIIAYEQCSVS